MFKWRYFLWPDSRKWLEFMLRGFKKKKSWSRQTRGHKLFWEVQKTGTYFYDNSCQPYIFSPIFCRAKSVRRCDLGLHELPEHAFNTITSLNWHADTISHLVKRTIRYFSWFYYF